ncbi:MAG: MFS transporter, partial [Myxococcota bacterium]
MLNLYRTAIRGLPAEVWWYSAAAFVNRAGTMVLPFLALYLRDALQFSATDVGRILAAFGAGSLAGTFFSGALIDRFGGHRVQIGSLVLSGLAFIALVPLTSFIGLTIGVFGAAAVSEIFRPAVTSAIGSVIDPKDRARGFAVLRLAVNAGMAVGPALGGLAAQVDFTLIFWGEGITCILAGLFLAAAPVAAKS